MRRRKTRTRTPSEFAARVEREATRRGFERAARQAVLGDGAIWIWNLTDEHFPDAVQIVDRFHAKQHLSDVSKSIYGAGTDLAQQWASERHDELDAGDIDDILDALRLHSPQDDEARKCIDYVERNQERMRSYPKFRADGFTLLTAERSAGGSDLGKLTLLEEPVYEPLLNESFEERWPALSPDGRFMAYAAADEAGRFHIYVRPFPDVNAGQVAFTRSRRVGATGLFGRPMVPSCSISRLRRTLFLPYRFR